MGPLLVVFSEPGLGVFAHLFKRVEHVGIEHFNGVGLVEDEPFFPRISWSSYRWAGQPAVMPTRLT